MKYINLSKTLPEIFDDVRRQETNSEKVRLLSFYKQSKSLAFFVDSLYNKDWSSLPIPEYTPSRMPIGICYSNIGKEINRINAAFNFSKTDKAKAELLMIRILESVSADEAELLVNMFKGRKVDGISKSVFKEVYPEFFRFQSED